MNAIHDKLKIFCKDTECEHELLVKNFKEDDNEIRIKSCAKNNGLYRGWIGDLFYNTISRDVCDCNNIIARDTEEWCKDVLLVKINIIDDGYISWEYVFLKK